jgi:gliding motility-associated lipoprotein GldH
MAINRFCIGILLLLLITACSPTEVFDEYRSFPEAVWSQKEPAHFEVNIENNRQLYDVFIEIRNSNNYPFRNIWLFVDITTPDGKQRRDSINAELADVYGKWYGSGISLYTYSFPYERDMQYPLTGSYQYFITQGMREEKLVGISDIGLKVTTSP